MFLEWWQYTISTFALVFAGWLMGGGPERVIVAIRAKRDAVLEEDTEQ